LDDNLARRIGGGMLLAALALGLVAVIVAHGFR
jgi:hypothetical protein